MSAPLLIPASRDPGDTRPDASGQIPSVHYNIPTYQPLNTDAGLSPVNPLVRMLVGGTAATFGNSGVGQLNPLTGSGLLNLAGIIVPGGRNGYGERTGGPSMAQEDFLSAIRASSLDNRPRVAYHFDKGDPGVQALMRYLGSPATRDASNPPNQIGRVVGIAGHGPDKTDSPLNALIASHGVDGLGALPDYSFPREDIGVGGNDIPSSATRNQFLKILLGILNDRQN